MKENINYAKAVEKELNYLGMNFDIQIEGEDTIFSLPMSSENVPGLNVKLRMSEKGDSKIWCFLAKNVKKEKRAAMLETLNSLNDRYRFLRLSLDQDSDVAADYDFILCGDEESAAEYVVAIIFLLTEVMDKCVKSIISTIWREDSPNYNEMKVKLNLFEDAEGGEE